MKDGNQSRYASDEDILTLYNRRDEQAIAATQSKYGSYLSRTGRRFRTCPGTRTASTMPSFSG